MVKMKTEHRNNFRIQTKEMIVDFEKNPAVIGDQTVEGINQ